MPAVDKEHHPPTKLLLPSLLAHEAQLQGRPGREDDGKDEAQVQVQDFAPSFDANLSYLKAGEAGEVGQVGEDADDDDANNSDDISPGGHHHSPGYARRLRRARRDIRREVRSRNGAGVGSAEMAAGRECEREEKEVEKEEEEETEEKEEEEHGLAEVFERFRLWKWRGQ